MRICDCLSPTRDPHTGDHERCLACGGFTPHGCRAPHHGFDSTVAELHSLLDRITSDWHGFANDPTPARRGEAAGSSDLAWSDPTGDAATATRRAYIDGWLVLCARFLDRARVELTRADDAIGRALYVADPRPPERLAGNWWDNVPVTDTAGADDSERSRLLAAQARRRARGES